MKIKFLGVKGEVKKTGCPVCGKRMTSSVSSSYQKRMILPSNRVMVFIINHEYEVSEEEGQFLLNWHYSFRGKELYPFVKL